LLASGGRLGDAHRRRADGSRHGDAEQKSYDVHVVVL
jgi:hypothetical protein